MPREFVFETPKVVQLHPEWMSVLTPPRPKSGVCASQAGSHAHLLAIPMKHQGRPRDAFMCILFMDDGLVFINGDLRRILAAGSIVPRGLPAGWSGFVTLL